MFAQVMNFLVSLAPFAALFVVTISYGSQLSRMDAVFRDVLRDRDERVKALEATVHEREAQIKRLYRTMANQRERFRLALLGAMEDEGDDQ